MRRSIMRPAARMNGEQLRQGMLDTNILILRRWIDPAELPDEMAISAITLAELSAGPHEVRSNDEQDAYDERAERARRLEILQRAESEFDPVPFDAEAARIFGSVKAAVIAAGRKPEATNAMRLTSGKPTRGKNEGGPLGGHQATGPGAEPGLGRSGTGCVTRAEPRGDAR
jgi:predicted nucleic acid-binding protein